MHKNEIKGIFSAHIAWNLELWQRAYTAAIDLMKYDSNDTSGFHIVGLL